MGGAGGAAGQGSISKMCCISWFHNEDGVIKSLCSGEVPELAVSVPSDRNPCKENLFPSLGERSKNAVGSHLYLQPRYHACTWASAF